MPVIMYGIYNISESHSSPSHDFELTTFSMMTQPLFLSAFRPVAAPTSRLVTRLGTQSARRWASSSAQPSTLIEDKENGFGFIRHNERPPKPRSVGVTEIRGPYYSAMGKRYLSDVFET